MKKENFIFCKMLSYFRKETERCKECKFYQAAKVARLVIGDSDFQLLVRSAKKSTYAYYFHTPSEAYVKLHARSPDVIVFRNASTKETIAFVYKYSENVLHRTSTTNDGIIVTLPMVKLTLKVI